MAEVNLRHFLQSLLLRSDFLYFVKVWSPRSDVQLRAPRHPLCMHLSQLIREGTRLAEGT